jgi:hypothetical protein
MDKMCMGIPSHGRSHWFKSSIAQKIYIFGDKEKIQFRLDLNQTVRKSAIAQLF